MTTFSTSAYRAITPTRELVPILQSLTPADKADDILIAAMSEAMDLAVASQYTRLQWIRDVSRLCGKDSDLLPPVRFETAKCPDIPDFPTNLSAEQDDIGMKIFSACSHQSMTSVQATLACLMVATMAAESCGLTRRAWKEYAQKIWELWHVEAKTARGA